MGRGWLILLVALGLGACKPGGREQGSGLIPPADAPAAPIEPAGAPASAPAGAPLPESHQAADLLAGPLDLSGTTPAWTLQIRRDTLSLQRPGRTEVLAVNPGLKPDGVAAVWETVAAASGDPLRIRVAPAPCPAAGAPDPLTAVVEYEGETLNGCGRAPPARGAGRTASAPAPPSPPRTADGASLPQG